MLIEAFCKPTKPPVYKPSDFTLAQTSEFEISPSCKPTKPPTYEEPFTKEFVLSVDPTVEFSIKTELFCAPTRPPT